MVLLVWLLVVLFYLIVVIDCCTRLSIRLSTRGTRLSTHSIYLSTLSTRLAIRRSTVILVVLCRSFYN